MARKDHSDSSADPAPAEAGKIPEGGLSRGFKLGTAFLGAMARAGSRRLIGSPSHSSAVESGERLAATLGKMKGLSMKLGQMLSYADVHTPPGWKEALSRLQHESPPMHRDVVFQVVKEDLGHPPDVLFSSWEPKPIAAASIGQVHRARLRDGTDVAVKVRYPNIERVVRQDLDNMQLLRRFGSLMMPEVDTDALMGELRERFLAECDYLREAESQTTFRAFFQGDDGVVVPEVYRDHCSGRVLTTALVDGQRFDEFVRTASQSERDLATRSIHNFAFKSIYRLGALNCDPHPGNYLFVRGAVAFLDFGCVRRFPASMVEVWRAMVRSALEQDHDSFSEAVVGIGLAEGSGSFDFAAHYRQYLHLIRPWLTEEAVTLTPEFVNQSYRALLVSNPNRAKLRMPRELLFANRLQWGLYSVLAHLRSTLPLREEILNILYEPGETRPPPFSASQLRQYLDGFQRPA